MLVKLRLGLTGFWRASLRRSRPSTRTRVTPGTQMKWIYVIIHTLHPLPQSLNPAALVLSRTVSVSQLIEHTSHLHNVLARTVQC